MTKKHQQQVLRYAYEWAKKNGYDTIWEPAALKVEV